MKCSIRVNSEGKTENLRSVQVALRYSWTSREYSLSPLPLRLFAGSSRSSILCKFWRVKTQQLGLPGFSNKSGSLLWPFQKESITSSTVFKKCFILIYTPTLPFTIPHIYVSVSSITMHFSWTATIFYSLLYLQLPGNCQEHSTPPDKVTC